MISVRVLRDSSSAIRGFEVTGHAGHAQFGHDIVCAAVSSLCIAIANGLEKHATSPVYIEAGDGEMRVVSQASVVSQGSEEATAIDNSSSVLYDTLVDALEAIAEEYPGRVSITHGTIEC